jgi:hypothetical protein
MKTYISKEQLLAELTKISKGNNDVTRFGDGFENAMNLVFECVDKVPDLASLLPTEKEAEDYAKGNFGYDEHSIYEESAFTSGTDWFRNEIEVKERNLYKIDVKKIILEWFPKDKYSTSDAIEEIRTWYADDRKKLLLELGQKNTNKDMALDIFKSCILYANDVITFDSLIKNICINTATIK